QNRLNNYAMGASCSATGHIATIFSPAGNVQRRTDICNTSGCMTYGSGAGPHALTGITGTVNGIVNPAFTYDGNGNMTAGLGRSYSWTSYNMASQITAASPASRRWACCKA
ncbi:MAG TPA: hypothetical protein VHU87_02215, partial [Rhizomicrobium sp.]|nr:hypothetical protein [Rhizomicrobium sp.]